MPDLSEIVDFCAVTYAGGIEHGPVNGGVGPHLDGVADGDFADLRDFLDARRGCLLYTSATVVEGPYWAGREDGKPPVPFLHYVEWLADALRKGKIKIDPAKRLKMPVTLQDSCNYIRNHGLAEHTRYIMSQIAEDFREMKCNREDNFCCGGGGGFNGIGKFRPQRDKGLYMKLQQIRETGAKMVISPCHNCWDAIRDMMEVYHVHDIKWSFLKPIIIDMMIVPDHLKPQDDE